MAVRALASHQCGLGLIPRIGVTLGLSLLVFCSAWRGFPPGIWFSPQKTNIRFDVSWLHLISFLYNIPNRQFYSSVLSYQAFEQKPFLCRSCYFNANEFLFTYEKKWGKVVPLVEHHISLLYSVALPEVCSKARSTPASLLLKGLETGHRTVKWSIKYGIWRLKQRLLLLYLFLSDRTTHSRWNTQSSNNCSSAQEVQISQLYLELAVIASAEDRRCLLAAALDCCRKHRK